MSSNVVMTSRQSLHLPEVTSVTVESPGTLIRTAAFAKGISLHLYADSCHKDRG